MLADGGRYEGLFRKGVISGQGTMHYANGDKFAGSWKLAEPHGDGTKTFADGAV